MVYAGIDAGSRTIKTVLFDADRGTAIGQEVDDQGVDQEARARAQFARVLGRAGLEPEALGGVVATGYGRNAIEFAGTTVTEITCHAAGVRHLCPAARTVIDIGGEDSKVLRLDEQGKVEDFAMNDRCAAGTGRFLEIVARRLETEVSGMTLEAVHSEHPAAISSMCVVFAETEIIGLLAAGTPRQDIMAGVQAAIASRVHSMVNRHARAPFVFTGGVALVPGMQEALSKALDQEVTVCPSAQLTGALGAALLAAKRMK